VVAKGPERGVIVNAPSTSVVRLTPPLIITDNEIDAAVERIALALADATENERNDS